MIDFISAFAGGIKFSVSGQEHDYWASNAIDLAAFIAEFGVARGAAHSSTMDFASEEGFASDDDAWKLWEAAINA